MFAFSEALFTTRPLETYFYIERLDLTQKREAQSKGANINGATTMKIKINGKIVWFTFSNGEYTDGPAEVISFETSNVGNWVNSEELKEAIFTTFGKVTPQSSLGWDSCFVHLDEPIQWSANSGNLTVSEFSLELARCEAPGSHLNKKTCHCTQKLFY